MSGRNKSKSDELTVKLPPMAKRVRIIYEVDLPAGVDVNRYAEVGADYLNSASGNVLRHNLIKVHETAIPSAEVQDGREVKVPNTEQ
jgi:hypothetical protein